MFAFPPSFPPSLPPSLTRSFVRSFLRSFLQEIGANLDHPHHRLRRARETAAEAEAAAVADANRIACFPAEKKAFLRSLSLSALPRERMSDACLHAWSRSVGLAFGFDISILSLQSLHPEIPRLNILIYEL